MDHAPNSSTLICFLLYVIYAGIIDTFRKLEEVFGDAYFTRQFTCHQFMEMSFFYFENFFVLSGTDIYEAFLILGIDTIVFSSVFVVHYLEAF